MVDAAMVKNLMKRFQVQSTVLIGLFNSHAVIIIQLLLTRKEYYLLGEEEYLDSLDTEILRIILFQHQLKH
jgi:hypothetical protein